MKIIDLIRSKKKPTFSIEFMPPRNGEPLSAFEKTLDAAKDSCFDFFTITNGSGGSSRAGTAALAKKIQEQTKKPCAAHLTCLKRSKEDLEEALIESHYLDLNNIVALRGDPSIGEGEFKSDPNGYANAVGLVKQISGLKQGKYLKRVFHKTDADYFEGEKLDFCVGVAGYPEKHKDAKSFEEDLSYLKEKVDAGADYILTQMCFSSKTFFGFVNKCKDMGINVPIICGILPITSSKMLDTIEDHFGVTLPDEIKNDSKQQNDKDKFLDASVKHTMKMVKELLDQKVDGIHFYSLNRSKLIKKISEELSS